MTLDEIDATLAASEKRLGHLQVSTEERESAMIAGELGKYPGDEAVIPQFETAGKQEFQKLRTDRLKLTDQVKKARVEDQAFKDRESLWGQTKQFASDLFAPHDLMRGAVPPKPTTAPSIQALDAPQQELTLPEVQIRAPHPDSGARLPSFTNPDEEEAFKSWYSGKMETDGWPKHYKDAPVDARKAFRQETTGLDSSAAPAADYGLRTDGTPKGKGFFGALPSRDPQYEPGTVSTELSADADIDGVNVSFPLLTPNLTRQEIDHLLTVGKPTSAIYDKAIAHAQQRLAKGLSPFASDGEQVPLPEATPSVQALDLPRSVAPDDIVGDVKPAPNLFAPGVTGRLDAQIGKTPQDPTARYPSAIPDKPLSLGEAFQQFGSQTLRGMGTTGASALKGLGIIRYELDQATMPTEHKDKTVQDYALFKAGQTMEKAVEHMFPGRKDLQQNFLLTTVPQALGSSVVFLGTGAAGASAGMSAGLTAAVPGALVGGAGLYEKGMKAEVSPEKKRIGLMLGAALGATEGIPIADLFRRMDTVTGGNLTRALKIGTLQAIEEAVQEGVQGLGENATVQVLFGQNQQLLEGVGSGMGAGGLIGFLTGAISTRLQRHGHTLEKDETDKTAPPRTMESPTSGPAKTSSAVANSPFGSEPTPRTGIPQVDNLPDELQVRMRPPSLIKQQPSPAAPVVTPGTVPTSQNQAPLSVSPEGGPLSVPLPPASAPGMESPSLAPQPAVTPEAIVPGADLIPTEQPAQAPDLLQQVDQTIEEGQRKAEEPALEVPEVQITDTPLPPAPATFTGIQRGVPGIPDFELYNLTEDIPGHPAGSTVTRETLENAGYEVPAMLIEEPSAPEAEASKVELPPAPAMMNPEDVVIPAKATEQEPGTRAQDVTKETVKVKAKEIQAYIESLPQDEAKRAYARALVEGLRTGNLPPAPTNLSGADIQAIQAGLMKAVSTGSLPKDASDKDLVPAAAREQKGETPETAVAKPDKAKIIPTRGPGGSIEYVVQPLRPGATPETLTLPKQPEKKPYDIEGAKKHARTAAISRRHGDIRRGNPSLTLNESEALAEKEVDADIKSGALAFNPKAPIKTNAFNPASETKPGPAYEPKASSVAGKAEVIPGLHEVAVSSGISANRKIEALNKGMQETIDRIERRGGEMSESDRGALREFQGQINRLPASAEQELKQKARALDKQISDLLAGKKPVENPTTPVDVAAHEAATSPTNEIPQPSQAQKEAGNYTKGHVTIAGLDISIENPAGSVRSGTDARGNRWSISLNDHYGYLLGTKGKDKDHLDVFIKPGTSEDYAGSVFVIDQMKPGTKTFDEHKIIFGVKNSKEARELYLSNYAKDWNGLGSISTFSMPQFKGWLKNGDHTKPAVNYKIPVSYTVTEAEIVPTRMPDGSVKYVAKNVKEESVAPTDAVKGLLAGGRSGKLPDATPTVAGEKNTLIKPSDIQAGDRYFTAQEGYLTVEKVYPFDPKYPKSQLIDTDRGRRDIGHLDTLYVDRKADVAKASAAIEKEDKLRQAAGALKDFKANPPKMTASEYAAELKRLGNIVSRLNTEESTAPTPESETVTASTTVANWVKEMLSTNIEVTSDLLFKRFDKAMGGTQAEGKYTPKDAYDALELGINLYLQEKGQTGVRPGVSVDQVKATVKWIREHILSKIPTQTRRTDEQNEFQQFSTPPDLALVMDWAAGIAGDRAPGSVRKHEADVVLEPSAGIGGLAVLAQNEGATVYVNEFDPRRAALLKPLGFTRVFTENAEQLHNILPSDVKPTVILMNPPFSSTAGRISGQRKTANVFPHLDQALKRLQPGGRLVALIAKGKVYADPQILEDWIAKTAGRYAYRARIGLSGKGYAKYGTSYSNQILVFDKIAPDGLPTVIANVEDVMDAIPLLKEVRDARHYGPLETGTAPHELPSAESTGKTVSEAGTPTAGPRQPLSPPTGSVGAGQSQGLTPESSVAGTRPAVDRQPSDVAAGGSTTVSQPKSGRSTQPTPDTKATPQSDVWRTGGEAGPERTGSGNVSGSKPGLPPEQVSEALTLDVDQRVPLEKGELTDSVYDAYAPQKAIIKGAKAHPGKLVESAALAAVEAPDVTYRPTIPQPLIDKGELSAAQLEAVVYAGEAHQHMLATGERKGFLIGDGPGVGKGRTLAAIILDNWKQGRKKAVWISETQNLVNSAVRDWTAMGQKESDIFGLNKYTRDQPIDRADGVLYTTYTTMASGLETMSGGGLKAKQAKGAPVGELVKTRLDQTVAWLGKDFDGVIIFDEAHNMQNSLEREGERGDVSAAAKALASVTLQQLLPKARIVYSSATAATRVDALAFADRLGLWGEGTPFPTKGDFIQSIEASGLGAMEIVAQNMKAMGAYMSRNLDYAEVKYRKLEHALTPEQEEVYNAMARGWQVVLQNLDKALEMVGVTGVGRSGEKKTMNGRAKGAAYGKFWGANQRFFNQILTSMQLPSVVADMRKQLDAGKSILVQLVNTNEAIMQRQLQSAEQSGEELDSVDMTPRQNLMQYIENAFPTAQFEEYTEPGSTAIKSRMVLDSEGRPVQNAEAVALKERMLAEMGSMRVPEGPLEILINTFGTNVVAEVTGRAERLVRVKNEDDGTETVQRQKRSPSLVKEDVTAFMAGKKRLLVFSDKGGTGESYHADNTKKNRQQRIHYLLQPGWRADKAVQGLGRSHRTNQASAPEYVLTMTNIKGHKRFISTIARRLDQLGALTKGQRQAGSSGLIEAKDNLENRYAAGAVRHFFLDMFRGHAGDFNFGEVTRKLGLNNLVDKDGALIEERLPGVPQFLNRMLSLELADQNTLFDEFFARMSRAVDIATQDGSLDTGMETYRADGGIRLLDEQEIHRDPQSKATVMLGHYEAKHSIAFIPTDSIEQRSGFKGYIQNHKTGKVWAKLDSSTRTTEEGAVLNVTHLQSPVYGHSQYVPSDDLTRLYTSVSKGAGRTAWDAQVKEHPPFRTESFYLATGNILRIWDRFPSTSIARIRRIQTSDGRKALGRIIPEAAVDTMMAKLGKGEKSAPSMTPSQAFDAVLDEGTTLTLANDWTIKRARVNQEPRLEITGTNLFKANDQLKGYGVFTETIQYSRRYFIPTDKSIGERVLERILSNRPIVEAIKKGAEILKSERGSIPVTPFGSTPKYSKDAEAYRKQRAEEERGFISSDADIETRVRAAKQGVLPESLGTRIKENAAHVWHLVSREFEHLPNTAEFSPLRTSLLQLQKYKGIAADAVQRDLAEIIKPLSRKQYDQFEWKALLSDLKREAEQERALPFGYTPEKVAEDLERLDAVIAGDPVVQEAWKKRQDLWASRKRSYQAAMDAIGFDTSRKLTKEDYFRHQVLEYSRERYLKGTGSQVRTPTGRGFLQARHGSTMDINANYVQAEFEVMTQMVYDTQLAKVVRGVDESYNIRRELAQQAKDMNNAQVQRIIGQGDLLSAMVETQMKDFRKRIGMNMSQVRKALDLDKTDPLTMEMLAEIADDAESPGSMAARGIFKAISERKAFVKDLLGKNFATWQSLIPETHDLWQPREGNVFYMADSIPAQLAKVLQEGLLSEVGLTADKLHKVLSMGNEREQYVIPKEAKLTLDGLSQKEHSWFVDANRHVINLWKQLMLVAPRRVIRYNVRNLTGDADALFVGNPGAFKKFPQAGRELIPVIFKETLLEGEAKQWVERGGYGTTLQTQELGEINDLKAFRLSLDRAATGGWLKAPATLWNAYWKSARLSTDYRESIGRYAAYLDYLEQMQASPQGRPKNFGASRPDSIMALSDIRDRAFKLSNELLGAYDRVSVAGQTLRSFWIPFWSWQEVNATRYAQLIKNALHDGTMAESLSKMSLIGARKAAWALTPIPRGLGPVSGAAFLIRLAAFWSTLQAWNYLAHGDDEDELKDTNPAVAHRPHLLLGRDENGKIRYLAGIGALGDLLSWVGLDEFPGLVGDIMHDRMTMGEAVKRAVKAPVNKLWGGITPTVKMPVELAFRQSTYPDVFQPRPINDRVDYLAYQTTLGPEIMALRGKPGKPLYGGEDVTGLLVQRTDPQAASYWTWQGIERKHLERMGKESSAVFWRSARGEALLNWSKSIEVGDSKAEATWRNAYEQIERDKYGMKFTQTKMYKDIEQSLRSKAPLAGMTVAEREATVATLDEQERRTLERAETYYKEHMLLVLPEVRRRAFTHKLERKHWLTKPTHLPPELLP